MLEGSWFHPQWEGELGVIGKRHPADISICKKGTGMGVRSVTGAPAGRKTGSASYKKPFSHEETVQAARQKE